jgi:hypothetical protein
MAKERKFIKKYVQGIWPVLKFLELASIKCLLHCFSFMGRQVVKVFAQRTIWRVPPPITYYKRRKMLRDLLGSVRRSTMT